MEKLKPCPFCGGEAILERVPHYYGVGIYNLADIWTVSCRKCDCKRGPYYSKIYQDANGEVIVERNGAEKAINEWNTRADS